MRNLVILAFIVTTVWTQSITDPLREEPDLFGTIDEERQIEEKIEEKIAETEEELIEADEAKEEKAEETEDEKDKEEENKLPPFFWDYIGFQPISEVLEINQRYPAALTNYLTLICQERLPGEYFRLEELTRQNCGSVGTCHLTRGIYTLLSKVCEKGQLYDVDDQECKDADLVKNCDVAFGTFDLERKDKPSVRCNEDLCKSPNCYCSKSGFDIPGGLDVLKTPQFININFEGANGHQEQQAFSNIFSPDRKNPNGCNIKGTWYLSHKYSNYAGVEQLSKYGHEIGTMGVTRKDSSLYWVNARNGTFYEEFVTARRITEHFAFVPKGEIIGTRVPYLYPGGEKQFQMMEKNGFLYDNTIVVQHNDFSKAPTWPYNVKFGMPHECHSLFDNNCPNFEAKYDVWEMPINEIKSFRVSNCPTLSNCQIDSEKQFHDMLEQHFLRHFYTNRAPIQLSMQAGFFRVNSHLDLMKVLTEFIDDLLVNNEDVYFATNKQILEWIYNPVPIEEMKDFEPLKGASCAKDFRLRISCVSTDQCIKETFFDNRPENIYLFTCAKCPPYYPWIGNDLGQSQVNY